MRQSQNSGLYARKHIAAERRKTIARGECNEPLVGNSKAKSPGRAIESDLSPPWGSLDFSSYPGIRFAHPWLFSSRPYRGSGNFILAWEAIRL